MTENINIRAQQEERAAAIGASRRIVLKLGTRVLLSHYLSGGKDGYILRLIDDIAEYRKKGYEFAIVSSGAVGFGMQALGLEMRPGDLKKKQALASIGQALLMQKWNELFRSRGLNTGQILVTYDIIENRKRFLHTRDCLLTLFRYEAIPIINENDSVSVDELKFGDNDTLSALVSILIDADLLVLFTDTGGLYNGNPKHRSGVERIAYLDKIDESVFKLVEDRQNAHSLGGMLSKLQAAKRCTQGGASVVICDGIRPDLAGILEGRDIGTFIKADRKFQSKRKRWIYFNSKIRGKIFIDKGAESALLLRGKSLLPGGVTAVEGKFPEGTMVGIYNSEQQLIGKGITYYASEDILKIKGRQTGSISKSEVPRFYPEIIHRDNMVVLKREE